DVDDLQPVKGIREFTLGPSEPSAADALEGIMTNMKQAPGRFRAVAVTAVARGETLALASADAASRLELLELKPGDRVAFMPYYGGGK
ncbi:MAG TPA: hypothetical protein VL588_04245, partial [Bdellovibrionota bacterium]|nr:hypothetical protein [Bdellovibrionota bacterium]